MDIDKVDMSLDDIIKLNKKGTRGRGNGQRGGRVSTNSRGAARGGSRIFTRGGGATKMRGRGQNRYADATQSPRGRRGRGRGNIGVSPLNIQKGQSPVKNVRGGGRGGRGGMRGGRGGMRGGRGRGRGQGANGQTQQSVEQNSKVGFTSLNRRRMQAIESLLKAKQTLAELNAKQRAQQKQSRAQVVNTRRGLQTSPEQLNQTSTRVGRGRGGRGGLSRFGSTMSLNSVGSQKQRGRGRGLNNSFSGSTMSINSIGSQKPRGRGRGRGVNKRLSGSTVSLNSVAVGAQQNQNRRQWRTPKAQTGDQPILTVSVKNSPKPQRRNRIKRYQTQGPDPDLQAQIANLKPAVSQKYNFKMAVFAQASTSTSLSDRFTATSPNQSSFSKVGGTGAEGTGAAGTGVDLMGRKVFF